MKPRDRSLVNLRGDFGLVDRRTRPEPCPMNFRMISALVLLLTALGRLTQAASIGTIAGTGERGYSGDGGPALKARLDNPFGAIRGADGAIWFCEYSNHVVRRIAADGVVDTIVGNGRAGYAGDGGPAIAAAMNQPHEIRFDRDGNLFIADMRNHAIRRWDAKSKRLAAFAGNGQQGYSGDGGPAANAQFKQPHSLQFAPDGDLFVCDTGNHVVRRIDARTGFIETFAGIGKAGPTPDGSPIKGTPLNGPRSLDFDRDGNLWLATREGNQVFKFNLKTGRIQHIAGTGKKGFTGNSGPAKDATLSGPKGIAVAPNGDVYLCDTESHSIRRIKTGTGILDLVAGTGVAGNGPDGDPLACKLARPHGVFVEADGSVLIGDSENHRVRVLRP